MTSYEFEVSAKNAIIQAVEKKYNEKLKIQEINTVWFCWILRNIKGIFADCKKNNERLYEVTYNSNKEEMYVDVYQKDDNQKIELSKINTKVEE